MPLYIGAGASCVESKVFETETATMPRVAHAHYAHIPCVSKLARVVDGEPYG